MKLINAVSVLYYQLSVPPERVREAFSSAIEFKNPTGESFSIVEPPKGNAGLLVIDLKGENRHVFVLPVGEDLVLINDSLPRVFVVPRGGLGDFFRALAEDNPDEILDRGLGKKGKKWRFLIDFIATLAVVSIGEYFNLELGVWGAVLLGAVFGVVEYLLGPKKGNFRTLATELNEKTVKKVYEVSEKKGKVVRVSL
ncbi:hypothetical protein TEU_07260 [Thermococcus eurythermalis]|uniref:Uncharacterized protein n=1 Tax=Thermococcus eurythermalis TaxID=1505907 RepID=A0A097QUJ0_9EURY|nr:hypothetical protein [Thermococcus eurythermalis]AIU70144.1 hypothetical protein TEU_07260 [Thermococcus eurythermalis]